MRLLTVFFLLLISLSSCERKVEITPNPPVVTFNKPAFGTTFTSGKIYFTVRATSTSQLMKMELLRSYNGQPETQDTAFAISGSQFEWPYVFTAPDTSTVPTTIRLFFIVTDNRGVSSSAAFEVTLGNEPLDLSAERNGVIYHVNAAGRNALWDLVNNTARNLNDSVNSDMMNTSVEANVFNKGWRVPLLTPASVFVKSPQFDYTNATVKTVINAINNPSSVFSIRVNEVEVGDVFLMSLRNGAVGVLKVTQIDVGATSNDQRILFTYKKQG